MGHNSTGPPSHAVELHCICAVLQTPTDDDDEARRQQPLLVWPPTLCVGGPGRPIIANRTINMIKKMNRSTALVLWHVHLFSCII